MPTPAPGRPLVLPCRFPTFPLSPPSLWFLSLSLGYPFLSLSSPQVFMFLHSQLFGLPHPLSLISLLPPLAARDPLMSFEMSLISQTTRDALSQAHSQRADCIPRLAGGSEGGAEQRELYFSCDDEQIFYLILPGRLSEPC